MKLECSKHVVLIILVIFTLSAESKLCYHSGISQVTRVGKRFGFDPNHCNNESENKKLRMTIFSRTGRSWGNGDENQDKEIWIRARPENSDVQFGYDGDGQNNLDYNTNYEYSDDRGQSQTYNNEE